jgi:hypothetical protein
VKSLGGLGKRKVPPNGNSGQPDSKKKRSVHVFSFLSFLVITSADEGGEKTKTTG